MTTVSYDITGSGDVAEGGRLMAEAGTVTLASSRPARQPGGKTRPEAEISPWPALATSLTRKIEVNERLQRP